MTPRTPAKLGLRLCFLVGLGLVSSACVEGELVVQAPRPLSLEGRLEAGRVGEWECAWLVDAGGRRVDVMYPPGWEVRFHPVRLVDASGDGAAKEGDVVRVRGPEGIGDSVCSHDVFNADTVEILPPTEAH
jgi:hypothetical protein